MTSIENYKNGGVLNSHSNNKLNVDDEMHQVPLFPKANSILFNTGNIVSAERLKRRSASNPEEEILDALNNTLQRWIGNDELRSQAHELKSIKCRHPDYYELVTPEERGDISISVKLFLNTFDTEILERAIATIMEEIGTTQIDTLILSLPDKLFSHDDLPRDLMSPLWQVVQRSIQSERVLSAGLSDFNAKYLEQLCDSIDDKKYLPTLNQVNLTSCCKMPEDLVEYSKINNLNLTTHIDPRGSH